MPPRTSAPRRRTTPAPSALSHETRNSIAHHGSSITILWVLMVCMCIAVWMVLLVTMLRLDQLEATMAASLRQQASAQEVGLKDSALEAVKKEIAPEMNQLVAAAAAKSPSGALVRGSMSPDATKYAGYEDAVKGKIGIGVEIVATKQIKHIVIFDTRTESTGKGMPMESELSVRWKDAQTIEYDMLVKKNGEWVKETQSTKIYF